MDPLTAARAVKDKPLEFALQVGFHAEELLPEPLRVQRDRVGSPQPGFEPLVHELSAAEACSATNSDGMLEQLALTAPGHEPSLMEPGE